MRKDLLASTVITTLTTTFQKHLSVQESHGNVKMRLQSNYRFASRTGKPIGHQKWNRRSRALT